jgi:hypothetical protein
MWKNSFTVIEYVNWLLQEVYPENDIYLILDNWSAHKSNAFHAYADFTTKIAF